MGIPRPRNYLSNFFNVAVSHLALMYAYNFSSSRIGARLEPHHHDALPLPLPLLGVKGFIYPMEKIRRSREAALNNFSPSSSLTLPPPPPPPLVLLIGCVSLPVTRAVFFFEAKPEGWNVSMDTLWIISNVSRCSGELIFERRGKFLSILLLCYYYHGGRNVFAEDVRLRRFAGWIDGGESVEERC